MKTAFEEMLPHELEAVLKTAPVAYVPLGTFEHHGAHMPIGNDSIKAHALCKLVAEQTGGVVLPALYYGTGGGHLNFQWTIMAEERPVRELLALTFRKLAANGFKVIVGLTGHYPGEQTDMLKGVAAEVEAELDGVRIIGIPEYELYTPPVGDHAAKWETSLLMVLRPDLVEMHRLGEKPEEPGEHKFHNDDPSDPLYAIAGEDPRHFASEELGRRAMDEIVARLTEQVREALQG